MYSGARTQFGDGASPFAIPNIGIDASQHAIQRGAVTLDETVKQYFKIQDFGEEQRLESEVRGLQSKFDVEFKRRASLAPGSSSQALYDSDGTLRESVLQDLSDEYAGKIGELRGGFVLPESRMKSDAMRQRVGDSFLHTAYQKAALLGIQRTRQAFDEGLKGDLLRKDYAAARERYAQANQAGLITETAMRNGLFQVDQADAIGRFDNLAAQQPQQAYDLLDSEEYKDLFSPAELHAMRRKLASQARPAAAGSFFNSFVLTRKKDKGKSGTKNDGPEWTGFFTTKECEWIRAIEAGKGAVVRPQVAAAAAEEARAFNPSLSQEESEVARDAYIQKYSRFGLEKEWLGRQWTAADDMRKKLKTPTIDIKGRLNLLEKKGTLLNQQAFNAENQPYSNEEGWKSGGKFRDEFMGQLGLTPTETNKSAMAKYMAYARANHAAGLRSQISERFCSWRENDGKDATQAEQQAKLISLTREITGNRDISFVDEGVNQMDSNIANARDVQRSRFAQWAVKSGRKYWVDSTAQEVPVQRVSLGFDSTRKDLPAGILLPKSMMEGFDQENGVVEATFDNEHFRRFRVVGTCEGGSPQMSYAVAREGLYDAGRSFAVDMRIIKGDADQLMKQQDVALPAGKAVKMNKSALRGLAPYEQTFIDVGNKYGVDPKLLMAISMHETAASTSSAFRNKKNAMGISPNGGGPRSFDSVEESIDYAARLLKQHYLSQGLTTIESIGGKYAPAGADNDPRNLNQHWAKGVRKYYNSL